MLNVQDIGEHGLLKKLQSFCPANIVGDDGAVLTTDPHCSLVVTTDVLVDGVHFSDRTTTAYDVGWRATAANLSDLAAMGAKPLGITVGLSLPGEVAVSWVEELYRGMFDCLSKYQTSIVGGDICRSQVITVAITAIGQVAPHRVISRHNARIGDAIVVTGLHGLSRGGLELLLHPDLGASLTKMERERLIKAHQRPTPRLDVISWLEKNAPNVNIAGMDSSDGLADAIAQICQCSQVGAEIKTDSCKILPSLVKLAGTETAFDWMLYGGEDFELVLSVPPEITSALVEYLGQDGGIIGRVVSHSGITLINRKEGNLPQKLNLIRRFQHF
ncbi:MAG: thiamine-phosphate kinase [Pleurocapsa sp.]